MQIGEKTEAREKGVAEEVQGIVKFARACFYERERECVVARATKF